jgi:hypothetical protein
MSLRLLKYENYGFLGSAAGVAAASGLASVLGASPGLVSDFMASGLASVLGAAGVAAGAAGVVAAGALGAGVSAAQETKPAERDRPAITRRAFKFILVFVFG